MDFNQRNILRYRQDKPNAGAANVDKRALTLYSLSLLPWLEQHMMPTEQMLQGNRISPHLIFVFSPTQELEDMYEHVLNGVKVFHSVF